VNNAESVIAVVPVKRLRGAKRRLSSQLDPSKRRLLVRAMLHDVLSAVECSNSFTKTIVVSAEPEIRQLAHRFDAEAIPGPREEDHLAAVRVGISHALERGAGAVAILAADCPLLEPGDLDRLAAGLDPPEVRIAPDRHGTGTNALLLAPPTAIDPEFGVDSRARHLAAAARLDIPATVLDLPSLALDLDTPADVAAFHRRAGGPPRRGQTADLVRQALSPVH